MKKIFIINFFVFAIVSILLLKEIDARPNTRVKRVSSDGRLAELETLIGLKEIDGKLVTVPLGLGKINPEYIGRKRRSQPRSLEILFNQSIEDDEGDPAVDKEEDYYLVKKK